MVEVAYFGVDGRPCLSKYGYHGWRGSFDREDKEVEHSWFDTTEKSIPMMSIAAVTEVLPASEAGQRKILVCDIILQYGQWSLQEIGNDPNFETLAAEIEKLRGEKKRLVLYQDGNILAYEFPPGPMGIGIDTTVLSKAKFQEITPRIRDVSEERTVIELSVHSMGGPRDAGLR